MDAQTGLCVGYSRMQQHWIFPNILVVIETILIDSVNFVFVYCVLSSFANHLEEEERADVIALLLLSYGCLVTVNFL